MPLNECPPSGSPARNAGSTLTASPAARRPSVVAQRLGDRVEADVRALDRLGGQADAADRDRVADGGRGRRLRGARRREHGRRPHRRRKRPRPSSRTIPVNIRGGYRARCWPSGVAALFQSPLAAATRAGCLLRSCSTSGTPRPTGSAGRRSSAVRRRQHRRDEDQQAVDSPAPGTTSRASGRPRAGATGRLRRRGTGARSRPARCGARGRSRPATGRDRTRSAGADATKGTSRASRRGASARTVPIPTATASTEARSSWTRRRDSSPVTHRRPGTATRPST